MDYKLTFEDGSEAYLTHHGIKGQKWGDRKYQYEDGTLTPEGIKRYRELNQRFGTATGRNYASTQYTRGKIMKGVRIGTAATTGAGAVYGAALGASELGAAGAAAGALGGLVGGGVGSLVNETANGITKASIRKKYAKTLIKEHKGSTMQEVDDYLKLHVVADAMRQKGRRDV